jgi:hypothetical protein
MIAAFIILCFWVAISIELPIYIIWLAMLVAIGLVLVVA